MATEFGQISRLSPSVFRTHAGPLYQAFRQHRGAQAGLLGLILIACLVIFGPWLQAREQATDIEQIYRSPSMAHPLGTDQLGRDLALRVMEGGRVSLLIALMATVLATLIGYVYGLLAGMASPWLDRLMMQVLDATLAIPVLLWVIVSQTFGTVSLFKVAFVIGLAGWMGVARMVRTECRHLMESDFVKAAIVSGCTPLKLALRHILPNTFAPLVVVITVGIGQAILLESTLSFINLGVPATVPSWGNLLGNGMSSVLSGAWWMVVFPGMMIVLTVLCINLLGDGIRDTIDPKKRIT